MKLAQEFQVAATPDEIWAFFAEPEQVARCLPGVEDVTVIDDDNVDVRVTQSVGPMSATFDARVRVTERIENQQIRFTATGRSVRGAVGNVRAENLVRLAGANGQTTVTVDGDVALAGTLGSVGQKVVAGQAGRITEEFARNLQAVLSGEPITPPSGLRPARRALPLTQGAGPRRVRDPLLLVTACSTLVSALTTIAIYRRLKRVVA